MLVAAHTFDCIEVSVGLTPRLDRLVAGLTLDWIDVGC
jgi:hypothetical protein